MLGLVFSSCKPQFSLGADGGDHVSSCKYFDLDEVSMRGLNKVEFRISNDNKAEFLKKLAIWPLLCLTMLFFFMAIRLHPATINYVR